MASKLSIAFITVIFAFFQGNGQELTATQLLDKAIAYHDPDNVWPTFAGSFMVTMTTPDETNG